MNLYESLVYFWFDKRKQKHTEGESHYICTITHYTYESTVAYLAQSVSTEHGKQVPKKAADTLTEE